MVLFGLDTRLLPKDLCDTLSKNSAIGLYRIKRRAECIIDDSATRFVSSSITRDCLLSGRSWRPPRGVCWGLWPRGLRKPRGVMSAEAEWSVRPGFENFGGIKRVSHFFSGCDLFESDLWIRSSRCLQDWLKGFENSAKGRFCPGVAKEKAIWTLWAERLQTQIFLKRKFTPRSTSLQKHSLKYLHRKMSTHCGALTTFQWPM